MRLNDGELQMADRHQNPRGSERPVGASGQPPAGLSSPFTLDPAAFDQLPTIAAVLDHNGIIVATNAAWRAFGTSNDFIDSQVGIGTNYLEVCDRAEGPLGKAAPAAAQGVREVLVAVRENFEFEYRCPTSGSRRWFRLQVVPVEHAGRRAAMLLHHIITAQREGDLELRHRETAQHRIADRLPAWVSYVDEEFRHQWVTRKHEQWPGKFGDPIIGSVANEVEFPAMLGNAQPYIDRALSGEFMQFQQRIANPDGSHSEVLATYAPDIKADGSVQGVFVHAIDVTDLHYAERAVRFLLDVSNVITSSDDIGAAYEGVLCLLCETAGFDAGEVWVPDQHDRALHRRSAWCTKRMQLARFREASGQMTFIYGEGLPGRVWQIQRYEWLTDLHERPYKTFNRRKLARQSELRTAFCYPIVSDGRVVAVFNLLSTKLIRRDEQLVRFLDAISAQLGMLIALLDAQETLKSSEKRFRELVETMREGLSVQDADGIMQFVNRTFCEIVGAPREDILGRPAAELVTGESRKTLAEMWERRRQGDDEVYELTLNRTDGTKRIVQVAPRPEFDEQGDFRGSIAVVTDITELRHQQSRTAQLTAEIAHLNRLSTLGEMAASLAHELSQPLFAIAGYAEGADEMLRQPKPDLAELSKVNQNIVSLSRRATGIIDGLKSLVQRTDPNYEQCDIRALLEEMLPVVHAEARVSGIKVSCDFVDKLPLVRADRVQLQQVILNLAMNGIEAIRDHNDGHGTLLLRTSYGHNRVHITVADTGPGIMPNQSEWIFESFFTTKSDGLGMGLAISQSIVRAHGGRLVLQQDAGPGAVFLIDLPAATNGDPT